MEFLQLREIRESLWLSTEPGIITLAPFGMCQCLKGLKDVSTFASGINDMNPYESNDSASIHLGFA